MDIKTVLEVLQALVNVTRITQAALGIAREVREIVKEYKHKNG